MADEGETIQIVLADDHGVVRSALRVLLDAEPDFEVIAEAEDADGAARYTAGHKPNVLILDLNMPGESGLQALPRILEGAPETQVVVLTMQSARTRSARAPSEPSRLLGEACTLTPTQRLSRRLCHAGGLE